MTVNAIFSISFSFRKFSQLLSALVLGIFLVCDATAFNPGGIQSNTQKSDQLSGQTTYPENIDDSPYSFNPDIRSISNKTSSVQNNENSKEIEKQVKDVQAEKRTALQKEINILLAENAKLSRAKLDILQNNERKVFWTQCLVAALLLAISTALFSFWRFHHNLKFQQSINALTTGVRQFQDSLISFIDTNQLQASTTLSSYPLDLQGFEVDTGHAETDNVNIFTRTSATPSVLAASPTINPRANTATEKKHAPDELFAVKGFVDSWLRVYKPQSDTDITATQKSAAAPKSPMELLGLIETYKAAYDRTSYESVCKAIKKLFNIQVKPWESKTPIEFRQWKDFPHIIDKIIELWSSDQIPGYLQRLLNNSRLAPRQGFDLPIYQDIESLLKLAQNPNRPKNLQQLKQMPEAAFLFSSLAEIEAQADTTNTSTLQDAADKARNTLSLRRRQHILNQQIDETPAEFAAPLGTPDQVATSEVVTKKNNIPIASKKDTITPDAKQRTAVLTTTTIADVDASTKINSISTTNTITKTTSTLQQQVQVKTTNATTRQASHAPQSLISEALLHAGTEEKTKLAPHEIRLKLALAYVEMGDSEGACLLLEDVIRDAPDETKCYAQSLLKSIEEKRQLTNNLNSTIS